MIDTDSWWMRPGIAIWPNDDNIYNIKVKFDDKNGRIKLSSNKINKALTKEWIVKDYSERLNLSTGILIWNLEAKHTKSGSLHNVRSKAVCTQAVEAYAFLTGGSGSNQGLSSGTASKSSYLDYWWAVILIIAIIFFIFTQSGKRLKKIRRK